MPDQTTSTHRRVYEARIRRATAPTCRRFARFRRWRWTVTRYGLTDPVNSGVYEGRMHLWSESGYTFTWLGAALAAAFWITEQTAGGQEASDGDT